MTPVGKFEIPEEVGAGLSELLITREIRERVLVELAGRSDQYEKVEKDLITVVRRINAYKAMITAEYVPDEFKSDAYQWNYNGQEVDGNSVTVYPV